MLRSTTAPGRPDARVGAPARVAFHSTHSVGVPGGIVFAAQHPTYAYPCRLTGVFGTTACWASPVDLFGYTLEPQSEI